MSVTGKTMLEAATSHFDYHKNQEENGHEYTTPKAFFEEYGGLELAWVWFDDNVVSYEDAYRAIESGELDALYSDRRELLDALDEVFS